jgi:N-acetylmuramoyl-L-alanine amidase
MLVAMLARPFVVALSALAAAGCAPAGTGEQERAEPAEPTSLAAQVVELELPPATRPLVVYLDAGHGAEGNAGNQSSLCELEQDTMFDLSLDVAAALESYGGFVVVPSRVGEQRVPYAERVADAERIGADVFVSLHSDVRGQVGTWSPAPGTTCRAAVDAPGFSVLHADEGGPELAGRRAALCARVAEAMAKAGFSAYGGEEYAGLYAPSSAPGCFVDRHAEDKRIFVLRRPSMPSVIVETHNALDPREAVAWRDELVREAFARALAVALRSALDQGLSLR